MADFSKLLYLLSLSLFEMAHVMSPSALQTQWHFIMLVLFVNLLIITYNLQQFVHSTETKIA